MIRREANTIVWYEFVGLQGTGVTHAFLTRLGGVSAPPYISLNLGHTVGDDLAAVEENHRRACDALNLSRQQVVSPHQVHANHVQMVDHAHAGMILQDTDGLLTTTPGVALLLRFADCVPFLLYDATNRAVGVIHSGWRGAVSNIAQAAVEAFAKHVGSDVKKLWAGIGPAIGPCCYEVKADTAGPVLSICPAGMQAVQEREGRLYLDLPGLVRAQLEAAGVRHVEMSGICTACHTEEWFSHRAEHGRTGRFGALAVLAR
jgi:YfiH family protein